MVYGEVIFDHNPLYPLGVIYSDTRIIYECGVVCSAGGEDEILGGEDEILEVREYTREKSENVVKVSTLTILLPAQELQAQEAQSDNVGNHHPMCSGWQPVFFSEHNHVRNHTYARILCTPQKIRGETTEPRLVASQDYVQQT